MDSTKSGRFHRYVKEFPGFAQGLQEMQALCLAIKVSVEHAWQNFPIRDLKIPLGDALEHQDTLLMLAMIHQAYATPQAKHLKFIMAKATMNGFVYRSTSKYVYGWKKLRDGRYRCFVQLSTRAKEKLLNESHQAFTDAGWREIVRKAQIKTLGLSTEFALHVVDRKE